MNSAHSKPLPSPFPTDAVRGHDSAGPGAFPEEGRLARSVRGATVAMALAALAACGTTSSSGPGADYSSNSSVSTSGGNVSSPAAERVVDGVVELALTDQLLPDFDAAKARKLGTVHDGQPLYLYLRSTRPLGEIAHPVDPYGKNSFSGYPHLFVQIGDNQSLRIINTCYVTLTPAEAKATELIVPLAPLTNRVGDLPTDCWLETVTRADAVRQTLEVRLAGFPGKFESWLPVPDLLGVVAVDTDLSQGSNAWGQMLRAKPGKSPELPTKGRQGARRTSEREEATSKPVAASTEGRAPAQTGSSASGADAAGTTARAQTDTSPRVQTAAESPDRAAAQAASTTRAAAPVEAGTQTAPAATQADRRTRKPHCRCHGGRRPDRWCGRCDVRQCCHGSTVGRKCRSCPCCPEHRHPQRDRLHEPGGQGGRTVCPGTGHPGAAAGCGEGRGPWALVGGRPESHGRAGRCHGRERRP